jgi:hypothetical protein
MTSTRRKLVILLSGIGWLGATLWPGRTLAVAEEYPGIRLETGLFGVARSQAVRVAVSNHAMAEGLVVKFWFLDVTGAVVMESDAQEVALNHTGTFDYTPRPGRSTRTDLRLRLEVRGATDPRYVPGFTPTLEVFNPTTGRTVTHISAFPSQP